MWHDLYKAVMPSADVHYSVGLRIFCACLSRFFLPAVWVAFLSLLLTAALFAPWGTMTHAAAYWPMTLSAEFQSRERELAAVGLDIKESFLVHYFVRFDIIQIRSIGTFMLHCMERIKVYLWIFSLPFLQHKQKGCITLQDVSTTHGGRLLKIESY